MSLLRMLICSSRKDLRIIQNNFAYVAFSFFLSSAIGPLYGDPAAESGNEVIDCQDAFIYGLVEGVTEFLPISSTGHLILVDHWLHSRADQRSEEVKDAVFAYLIVIQVGAILSVAWLYRAYIFTILMGLLGRSREGRSLARLVFFAFLPAVVLGPLLDDFIESSLLGLLPIAASLILGSVLMLYVEKKKGSQAPQVVSIDAMSIKSAFVIGFLQCVAMWPGTSRSMMTIVGGYLVGLSRVHAAEFSFLLGLVTLSSAAAYKVLTKGSQMSQYLSSGPLLFGCLVAGISAAISVKWLVGYLSKNGLGIFAWYRCFLGFIVLAWYLYSI
jgi:undecaprenyl-diphosphatase